MLKTKLLCWVNNYIIGKNDFRGYTRRPIWEIIPKAPTYKRARNTNFEFALAELRRIRFDIKGNNNLVHLGTTSRMIDGAISIIGNNNKLIIGDNCDLFGVNIAIFGDDTTVQIGDFTRFYCDYQGAYLGAGNGANIIIGNNCLFGPDVFIRSDDAHKIYGCYSNNIINKGEDIIIGNHVWFGAKVRCLKGVHIEHDSVIAADSLLTKGIYSSNSVWGGRPIRQIKDNIIWEQ